MSAGELIGTLTTVKCRVDADTSTKSEIIIETGVVIGFEFILRVVFVVKALDAATIDRVPGIGGEVTAIGLGAVMTASDFAALAPLEELAPSCSTRFACWPTTIVDCVRPSQACKPSYQV